MWKKGRRPHGDTRDNTQHIQIPPPHQTHTRSRSRFFIRLLSRKFPRHHLPPLPGTHHGGDGARVVWDRAEASGDDGNGVTALIPRAGRTQRCASPRNSALPADQPNPAQPSPAQPSPAQPNARTDRKQWTESCSHIISEKPASAPSACAEHADGAVHCHAEGGDSMRPRLNLRGRSRDSRRHDRRDQANRARQPAARLPQGRGSRKAGSEATRGAEPPRSGSGQTTPDKHERRSPDTRPRSSATRGAELGATNRQLAR